MRRSLCKVRIWGVLGLLLVLVLAVGYGQEVVPVQPRPDPAVKLAAYPQELTSILSQVIQQFGAFLGGAQINISNAAMWVGSLSPSQPIGALIIAPSTRLDLRPGGIVGLIGIHNVPLGTPPVRTGFYAAKLPAVITAATNRLILVDQNGREVGSLGVRLPPMLMAPSPGTPPRVHLSMGLQDPVPPNYPSITLSICIGWKRANCDCIGIHIQL